MTGRVSVTARRPSSGLPSPGLVRLRRTRPASPIKGEAELLRSERGRTGLDPRPFSQCWGRGFNNMTTACRASALLSLVVAGRAVRLPWSLVGGNLILRSYEKLTPVCTPTREGVGDGGFRSVTTSRQAHGIQNDSGRGGGGFHLLLGGGLAPPLGGGEGAA